MNHIILQLDATEPRDLLRKPTPDGVWLRVARDADDRYWPEVEVMGPEDEVVAFVREEWGDDAIDCLVEAKELAQRHLTKTDVPYAPDNRCDECGKDAELFHNEATGLSMCESCDMQHDTYETELHIRFTV